MCVAQFGSSGLSMVFPPSLTLGSAVGRDQIMPLRAGAGWVAPRMGVEAVVEGHEAEAIEVGSSDILPGIRPIGVLIGAWHIE